MISPDFSLTRDYVINPTRSFRTPNCSWQKQEIFARVIAATTSFFALIDCIAHTAKGLYNWTWKNYTFDEAFAATLFFAKVICIGSLSGVINPKAVTHFELLPSLSDFAPKNFNPTPLETAISQEFANIIQIFNSPSDQQNQSPYNLIKNYCEKISQEERKKISLYMDTLNQNNTLLYSALLKSLYQKINRSVITTSRNNCYFYYLTDEEGLLSVLKTGRIDVGAFVSTLPVPVGNDSKIYTLVLDHAIEYMSDPTKSVVFTKNHSYARFIEFSRPIPVNKDTVRKVLCKETAATCVLENLLLNELPTPVDAASHEYMTNWIPKHWKPYEINKELFSSLDQSTFKQTTWSEDMQEPFMTLYAYATAILAGAQNSKSELVAPESSVDVPIISTPLSPKSGPDALGTSSNQAPVGIAERASFVLL